MRQGDRSFSLPRTEGDRIFIISPNDLPMVWRNQQGWQLEQEDNLLYYSNPRSNALVKTQPVALLWENNQRPAALSLLAISKPLTPLPGLFSTTGHSVSTTGDGINRTEKNSGSSSLDRVLPFYSEEVIAHPLGVTFLSPLTTCNHYS